MMVSTSSLQGANMKSTRIYLLSEDDHGTVANQLAVAVAALELLEEHPGLTDELCALAGTALTHLCELADQLRGLPLAAAPMSCDDQIP